MQRLIGYTIGLLVMYYVNYLGSATHVLGEPMSSLSTIFPLPYMPSGVVFMVARGAIFVLLALFMIQVRRHYFRSHQTQARTMYLFGATIVTNMLWMVTTGMKWYVVATLIIFLLLRELAMLLDIYKKRHLQKSIGRYTFGAYFGWVSIAACVLGVSQVLYVYAPDIATSQVWSWIVVMIGVIVTCYSWYRWKNPMALLFALWGLGGALMKLLG